jgi:hypothetical protein
MANIIVVADDALVRPSTNASAIAHVRVVNARELRIYAQHGSLDFSYHGTSETIPEGSAYKVLLDPSEKEARLEIRQGRKKASGDTPPRICPDSHWRGSGCWNPFTAPFLGEP